MKKKWNSVAFAVGLLNTTTTTEATYLSVRLSSSISATSSTEPTVLPYTVTDPPVVVKTSAESLNDVNSKLA